MSMPDSIDHEDMVADYKTDADTVHHISNTRPKAKKVYACSCCGKPIEKGEKHYKNVFKLGTDKRIRWERSHIKCPGW